MKARSFYVNCRGTQPSDVKADTFYVDCVCAPDVRARSFYVNCRDTQPPVVNKLTALRELQGRSVIQRESPWFHVSRDRAPEV